MLNPSRDNIVGMVKNWSNGNVVDAVLFSAATKSKEPLSQVFR